MSRRRRRRQPAVRPIDLLERPTAPLTLGIPCVPPEVAAVLTAGRRWPHPPASS